MLRTSKLKMPPSAMPRRKGKAPLPVPAADLAGLWAGRRAFVVGGGPSLRGFDFKKLRGERIIAVNRAFEFLPFAEIMFSMDHRFYKHFCLPSPAFRSFPGRKIWVDTAGLPFYGVETLGYHEVGGMSWDLKQGLSTGGNSGHAALNLALLMGADPIYLLGFDFAEEPGRTHFHSGYSFPSSAEKLPRFKARLEQAVPEIAAKGRRVVNLGPAEIKGLERGTFGELPAKPDFLAVSFFTDRDYEKLAQRLKASLDRFQIRTDIRAMPSRGTWVGNVGMKPGFMAKMVEEHPEERVVWIDADGVVQAYPILFHELEADVAAHVRVRAWGRELLGGTVFLAPTEAVRGMFGDWVREAERVPRYKDQKGLQNVIEKSPGRLRFQELPASYCQIFDTMRHLGRPVIEHFQASRSLSRRVQ
jgi:hypothetical protein